MSEPTIPPVPLRAQRERTIDALCQHFALDHLEVGEFESRLDSANRALTLQELERLTADLPVEAGAPGHAAARVPPTAAAAPRPDAARVPAPAGARAVARRAQQIIIGILGGATRRGRWTPAAESTAIAIMGGVALDYREAQLPPGETVLHALAFLGGVTVLVPPGLDVAVDGVGILGGFDHVAHSAATPSADAARLRIDGVAIMGGVDVRVSDPGEPAPWDAQHGQRHEMRRQLRAQREQQRSDARRLRDQWRGGQ